MGFHRYLVKKFATLNDRIDVKRLGKKKPITGVKTVCDIPYVEDGSVYHLLDIYYPENIEGKLPIVFDIHGGGWIYGLKDINKHYCMGIASKGFVVVNISYRLITEDAGGTFPKILQDVFSALNWTERHIHEYNGDLDNFFLTGDSAGAHLSMLVLSALADRKLSERLNISSGINIRAAGLTCGVADIESFLKVKLPLFRYLHKLFLGEGYKTSEYNKFLTIRNNRIEEFCPLFLNTCDGDFLRKDVLKFYDECVARGVETELLYYKKPNQVNKLYHVYSVLFPEYEESIKTTDAMISFFKRYLSVTETPD